MAGATAGEETTCYSRASIPTAMESNSRMGAAGSNAVVFIRLKASRFGGVQLTRQRLVTSCRPQHKVVLVVLNRLSRPLTRQSRRCLEAIKTTQVVLLIGSPEIYTSTWPWVPFKGNPCLDSLQKGPRARLRCIFLGCLAQA